MEYVSRRQCVANYSLTDSFMECRCISILNARSVVTAPGWYPNVQSTVLCIEEFSEPMVNAAADTYLLLN